MTNAEARFNKSLRPWKPEGSLGRTAQDSHLDSHTAPELYSWEAISPLFHHTRLAYACDFTAEGRQISLPPLA